MSLFLLTVRGVPSKPDLDEVRRIHNQVAGSPEAIAAARALGDVSHVVFTPVDGSAGLLFLDQWANPQGIMTFFSNPHVQAGGAAVFAERDAVVWSRAEGFDETH